MVYSGDIIWTRSQSNADLLLKNQSIQKYKNIHLLTEKLDILILMQNGNSKNRCETAVISIIQSWI